MVKVVITGGHHNSALVIAQALRDKGYQILWLGHRHTMIADPHDSLEYQEVVRAGFTFVNLLAGKFHPPIHILHLLRLPLGFFQALFILVTAKPQLILSFGGYIAVPVALAGKLLRIPLLTFEQTTSVGRANQLIAKFSQHNFLAWQSSLPYFPPATTQVVGLPLPQTLSAQTHPVWFKSNRPTLLVTGGKQGAHVINQAIFKILPRLLKDYNLIHQTGKSRSTRDFETAAQLKHQLPQKLTHHYHFQAHFFWETMISALKAADLVISRSGAHLTYELLALAKPAILIPLPFSYHQEQEKNAQKLAQISLGYILPQSRLTPEVLFQQIKISLAKLKNSHRQISPAQQLITFAATTKIVDFIVNHYPPQG